MGSWYKYGFARPVDRLHVLAGDAGDNGGAFLSAHPASEHVPFCATAVRIVDKKTQEPIPLKLKDWPPRTTFKETLPQHYIDYLRVCVSA